MALTARFIADFTSFHAAVEKAEVTLRGLETGASKVGTSLNKMADSFSGRKVIQDANLAVKAIDEIGDVTKLTKAEQERLNAMVTEALAKYKALGIEAPDSLRRTSTELKAQQVTWREMATAAAAVAGIVAGASLAIGKLGERGANVIDVKESFDQLTGAIGQSSDAILGKLRAATLGNISDFELMATANKAMSQGLKLTADQFGTLGDVAAVLADRTGGDVKEAFDTLTQAMATGQDRTLKTIGINIDAAKATEQYADSINKKVKDLDEDEKKQAVVNAILQEGQRILKDSGKAVEDFGDKMGQSRTKVSNFVDGISEWVATSPSLGRWTSVITAVSSTIGGIGLAIGPVSSGISKLLPMLGMSGGLAGGFSGIGTLITGTVLPALGAIALPLGGIAIAAGVAYLAWKHWDDLKQTFQNVIDWLTGVETKMDDIARKKGGLIPGAREGLMSLDDPRVKAAQEAGRLNNTWEVTLPPLGKAAKATATLAQELQEAREKIKAMKPALRDDLIAGLRSAAYDMDELRKRSGLSEVAFKLFVKQVQEAGKKTDDYAESSARLKASLVPLTAEQKKQIDNWLKTSDNLQDIARIVRVSQERVQAYKEETERAAKAQKDFNDRVRTFGQNFRSTIPPIQGYRDVIDGVLQTTSDYSYEMINAQIKTDGFGNVLKVRVLPTLGRVGKETIEAADKVKEFTDQLDAWAATLTQLAQVSGDTFGGIVKDIAEVVVAWNAAVKAGDAFEKATTKSAKALALAQGVTAVGAATQGGGAKGILGGALSGAALGSSLGSIIPGLGNMVGGIIGGISGAITGVIRSLSGRAGRNLVKDFGKQFGDLNGLRRQLGALGAEGERLWQRLHGFDAGDAKAAQAAIDEVTAALERYQRQMQEAASLSEQIATKMLALTEVTPDLQAALDSVYNAQSPTDYLAALQAVNGVIDEQAEKQEFLNQTMEKYGLTWTDLGDKARSAHVATEAAGIEKEFRALLEAGVDVNNIMRHMGDNISDFVLQAVKSGTEVPESFRDVIQTAIDAGELFSVSTEEMKRLREEAAKLGQPFDESKYKIDDIADAGVKFGITMETATQNIATAIERLIKLLEDRLGPAIRNLPDAEIDVSYRTVTGPWGTSVQIPAQPMALGGAGRVTKPTLFLAGESGPEDYAFSGANRRLLKSGGGQTHVTINLDGREIAWALVPHLPDAQAALA